MKKFLTIAGLLTVLATPAFAQSYDHDYGTGNIIDTPTLEHQTGRADASSAYAQAPEKHTNRKINVHRYGPANADPYSPANTGGGSEGYNWNLENDY
jgi:opacity protein-like surface antigen